MNRFYLSRTRIVMLAAAVAIMLAFLWHSRPDAASAADKDKKDAAHEGIAVETATAGRSDMPVYLEGLARYRRSTR